MAMSAAHVRAAYDGVAAEYAAQFADELAHKPFDRDALARFAATVGPAGDVYDLGCGPGHTTAVLHAHGARVAGFDLSPELVAHARRLHPGVRFAVADMLALPLADGTAAGLVAFYAIVHFTPADVRPAVAEMHRVLRPGGRLLLAFHSGNETKTVERFLGGAADLAFVFHPPADVAAELTRAGFTDIVVAERDAYPGVEYPSRRAYLTAVKPG